MRFFVSDDRCALPRRVSRGCGFRSMSRWKSERSPVQGGVNVKETAVRPLPSAAHIAHRGSARSSKTRCWMSGQHRPSRYCERTRVFFTLHASDCMIGSSLTSRGVCRSVKRSAWPSGVELLAATRSAPLNRLGRSATSVPRRAQQRGCRVPDQPRQCPPSTRLALSAPSSWVARSIRVATRGSSIPRHSLRHAPRSAFSRALMARRFDGRQRPARLRAAGRLTRTRQRI